MPSVDSFSDTVSPELLAFFNVNTHTPSFHDRGFHGQVRQVSLPHCLLKDGL